MMKKKIRVFIMMIMMMSMIVNDDGHNVISHLLLHYITTFIFLDYIMSLQDLDYCRDNGIIKRLSYFL
jgi:hypothetical protein